MNTLFQQTTTVIPLWWAIPENYFFDIRKGRVMDNYQLIYITQGRGWFHVTPEKRVGLEWWIYAYHSTLYLAQLTIPIKKTGWQEYWIGIRGAHIDSRYESGFFSCRKVVHEIGLRESIVGFYKEAVALALEEKTGLSASVGRHCQFNFGLYVILRC